MNRFLAESAAQPAAGQLALWTMFAVLALVILGVFYGLVRWLGRSTLRPDRSSGSMGLAAVDPWTESARRLDADDPDDPPPRSEAPGGE
jgi:hypothetical protein